MQIVKYQTEDESQQIIADKTALGFTLIEVANITEGNFLGFLEPNEPVVPVPNEMKEMKDNQLILMEVLATMYEEMLLKGTV